MSWWLWLLLVWVVVSILFWVAAYIQSERKTPEKKDET